MKVIRVGWMVLIYLSYGLVHAADIKVAVASNFARTMRVLVQQFEATSEHHVVMIVGSTGKHFAQITHGAPYDIFFAADVVRPEKLLKENKAVAGSGFVYAVGKLVLWSAKPNYVDKEGKVLKRASFRHLAIANPKLAPYGLAAKHVLQAKGLWQTTSKNRVRGENIGQTLQFVSSGSAELGFVALSQIKQPNNPVLGSFWLVPPGLYEPIQQHAVLLKDSVANREFMTFMQSEAARNIILQNGYGLP
ncbi:MAG: molybdate ABC transporter substrate-binding protein [Methylococcales bacterium]|jgi:molybdate transport system substrate-binding protein|nr:molybdate ABC transporter substrate-binding protein [Methylococcales bacterium]MBT7445120.1 molybdate ABC transporter substrate-binding protein [Methylococcales bacterium]